MSTAFYLKINNFEILLNFGLLVIMQVFVFENLPIVFLATQQINVLKYFDIIKTIGFLFFSVNHKLRISDYSFITKNVNKILIF